MADQPQPVSFTSQPRFRIIVGVVAIIIVSVGVWLWATSGRESTDDAQIDGHLTQISARVGGPVTRVNVDDNQQVEAGAVLAEIDPRDYQVAVQKAKASLADAQAAAEAAQHGVP